MKDFSMFLDVPEIEDGFPKRPFDPKCFPNNGSD